MEKKTPKVLDILLTVGIICCVAATSFFMYRNICYDEVIISGRSMEVTLFDGDVGLMKTTNSAKDNIQRFDIAIFNISSNTNEDYRIVKRVIGMPGETIKIEINGDILINGEIIDQSFLPLEKKHATYNNGIACERDYLIPSDSYFCLGDNRGLSSDSRAYGAFKSQQLEGVLKVIYKHCENGACKAIPKTWY